MVEIIKVRKSKGSDVGLMNIQIEHTNAKQKLDSAYGIQRLGTATKSGQILGESYKIDSSQNPINAYKESTQSTNLMEQMEVEKPAMTKNQMVVMSHSMSSEDFAKMEKEGIDPGAIDPEKFVTVMDKMKTSLIEAGVEIKGFTDQISESEIRRITGNDPRAFEIATKLQEADLPVTEYNINQVQEALAKGECLTTLEDGTIAYLVENHIPPTIDEVYKAQHSSIPYSGYEGSGYFQEPMKGYLGKKADSITWDSLMPQMDQIIQESSLDHTEESVNAAKWIVEHSIPLTVETLEAYDEYTKIELPKETSMLMDDIVTALVNQKKSKDTLLTGETNQYKEAVVEKNRLIERLDEITATREREELRLVLTSQVSLQITRQGFSGNIEDLEQSIDALKALEQELYQAYVEDNEPVTQTEVALFKETQFQIGQIPTLPMAVMGKIANRLDQTTIPQLYEQVMTVPMKEMGDSIEKAFQNIDAILEDLGLEKNETNTKAVRILGYNQMAITTDQIFAVKEADLTVQRIFEKMTPKATMELIHSGVNPLETSLSELEQILTKVTDDHTKTEEYAKFLYGLEQNKEITPEEKEAYIGIYRLMRQVEKSDGAAVGTLVNQGQEVNFKNLLQAVRSSKKQGMDVSIDATTGMAQVERSKQSITSQIENYYEKVAQQVIDHLEEPIVTKASISMEMSLEQCKEQLEQHVDALQEKETEIFTYETFREVEHVKEAVFETLLYYNQPIQFTQVLTAQAMMGEGNNYFKEMVSKTGDFTTEVSNQVEELVEHFDDYDKVQEVYEAFSKTLESQINTMEDSNELTAEQVRELSFLYKQISFACGMAKEENYEIPVLVEDEISTMNIKIIHNRQENPKVSITLALQNGGTAAAFFTIDGGKVNGYLVTSEEEQLEYVKQLHMQLEKNLEQTDLSVGMIQSFVSETVDTQSYYGQRTEHTKVETKELYQVAKQFMKATNNRRI